MSIHEHDIHFQYQPLDDAAKEIRVLILSPGKYADNLICRLEHVSVLDGGAASLEYQALSYTWGDHGSEVTLSLNGCMFWIRPNLDEALRRIRMKEGTVRLWIDAICIEQNNIPERNAQVRLMREVFQGAAKVLVWLGEADDDSDEALAAPPAQYTYFSLEEARNWLMENSRWKAVLKLGDRPWWSRIWVIQEVSVAKDVIMLCGGKSLSWDLFLERYHLSYRINVGLHRQPESQVKAKVSLVFSISLVRNAVKFSGRLGLLELLVTFRTHKCTDPRDKIFGILGLVTDDRERAFEVDYSMTVNTVYQKLVWHSIATSDSLNILAWAWSKTRRPGLPSWVPDWSAPGSNPSIGYKTWRWSDAAELHSAGVWTKAGLSFADDLGTLKVRVLSPKKVVLVQPLDDFAYRDGFIFVEVAIINYFRKANWFSHGTEEVTREAFRRTLIANYLDGKSISRELYTAFSNWFDREIMASRGINSRVDKSPETLMPRFDMALEYLINEAGSYSPQREHPWLESYKPVNEDLENKFIWAIANSITQSFFILENGYVGLGPENTKIGDSVCIPLGGEVPIVIQDTGDSYYEFIGECYVHNAMNRKPPKGQEDAYYNLCCTISLR